jgi:hypothetical protein
LLLEAFFESDDFGASPTVSIDPDGKTVTVELGVGETFEKGQNYSLYSVQDMAGNSATFDLTVPTTETVL